MAQYATLKAAIDAVIKANGQREITGTVLNQTLNAMVNSLGANYQFAGVATPSTNPGTPDQNVFYLAGQGGTYTNFNNIAIPNGISFLLWNGSWSSQTVLSGDGGVFDISAYKATGGTLATFADLSAALGENGANVPIKFGGMQVRFVSSSDNKYVQFRFMLSTFTDTQFANPIYWQGIGSPMYKSNNIAECGEVEASEYKLAKDNNIDFFRKATINDTNNSLIFDNVNIKQGYYIEAKLKASSNFSRIIVNYNGQDTGSNRILDISNGEAGKLYEGRILVTTDITSITAKTNSGTVDIELSYTINLPQSLDVYPNDFADNYTPVLNKEIDDSGNIVDRNNGRVIKCYISAGDYMLGGKANIYSMWRYTDDTYATPAEKVYPVAYGYSQDVATKLSLSSGYYAIQSSGSGNIYLLRHIEGYDFVNRVMLDSPLVNTRLTHNYVNTLTVKAGKAISNGAVIDASASYHYCIEHIPAGRYLIYSAEGSSSSDTLWKFTNSSCTTLSSQIIGKLKAGNMMIVDLVDGYYMFCFRKTANVYGVLASVEDELTRAIFDVPEIDYISRGYVADSTYINTDGQIVTAGSASYHTCKFCLLTAGKYLINIAKSSSSMALVKYTDITFSTPSEIIINKGALNVLKEINLDSGYYAIGWSGDIRTTLYKCNGNTTDYIKKVSQFVYPFNGQQIDALSLVGTATRNSDGTINVSGGIANKAEGAFIMSWYYSESARFNCSNGVSMIIGKQGGFYPQFGGYFEAYTDNSVSYVKQYRVETNGTLTLQDTKQLDFVLVENEDYELRINKFPKKMTLEIIGSYNEYVLLEFAAYSMLGKAFVSSNHTAVIKNFNLGLNCYYDIRNVKLGIWGHSYIAAAGSLGDDYMKSFSGLLAEEIGLKEVVNFGFGGDVVGDLNVRMKDEIKFVGTKMQYGMICVGENDSTASAATLISGLQELAENLIKADIVPILFTLEPDSTGYRNPNSADVNAWIRSSDYLYVDMDKVFWDENGNIRTDLYTDGMHPTIEGHRLIYNRIKMDCPFLF